MARHKQNAGAAGVDVRGLVAENLRRSAEWIYPEALRVMGTGADPAGWLRQADELDAGLPVVLPGWKVANYLDGPYPALVPEFRLEPDGTVTAMRRVQHGDTVDYVPSAGPALWRPAARLRCPRVERRGRG